MFWRKIPKLFTQANDVQQELRETKIAVLPKLKQYLFPTKRWGEESGWTCLLFPGSVGFEKRKLLKQVLDV